MATRKKTPKMIHEQLNRIMDYYMKKSWKNGCPSHKDRVKVYDKIEPLRKVAWSWINNIYKLAGVDPNGDSVASNRVWALQEATKEEYTNVK